MPAINNRKLIFSAKKNEKIIKNVWPHPFIFINIFVLFGFFLLIPLLIFIFLFQTYPFLLLVNPLQQILLLLCFAYYLMVLMFGFFIWMDNYLDFWTITDQRLVGRNQKGLFNRVVSELELYRVQDITVEQKGLLPTLLDYGDLYIQTAGEKERFVFKNAGHPVELSRLIQQLDEQAKKQHFNEIG